jgi:hypothetical protein
MWHVGGRREMHTEFSWENQKERELGEPRRIWENTIKCYLQKWTRVFRWSGLVWGEIAGSFEYGDELPGFLKCNFLTAWENEVNIKCKGHPRTDHEGPEGEYRYSYTLSLTSALDGGGWSAPRSGSFTPGNDSVPIAQEAGWAPGPVWTGAKNSRPPRFDPRTVQPVASPYTYWATPAMTSLLRVLSHVTDVLTADRARPASYLKPTFFFLCLKRQERESDRLTLSSAEIKNEWS